MEVFPAASTDACPATLAPAFLRFAARAPARTDVRVAWCFKSRRVSLLPGIILAWRGDGEPGSPWFRACIDTRPDGTHFVKVHGSHGVRAVSDRGELAVWDGGHDRLEIGVRPTSSYLAVGVGDDSLLVLVVHPTSLTCDEPKAVPFDLSALAWKSVVGTPRIQTVSFAGTSYEHVLTECLRLTQTPIPSLLGTLSVGLSVARREMHLEPMDAAHFRYVCVVDGDSDTAAAEMALRRHILLALHTSC